MRVAVSSAFWDNPSGPSLRSWLDRVAAIGFHGVTLFADYWRWGDIMGNADQIAAELAGRQLQLASLVTSVHVDFERYRRLAKVLSRLDCSHLVVIGGSGRDAADRRAVAGVLNHIGKITTAAGVLLSYHHHTDTAGESLAEVQDLLSMTDPSTVSLAFDAGHAALDFVDLPETDRPVAALRQLWNRVGIVELKDFSDATELDTVLGEGVLDLRQLLSELAARGYADWIVIEQNPELPRSDIERDRCARTGLERLVSVAAGSNLAIGPRP